MKKKLLPAFLLSFVNILGISILIPVLPFIVENNGAPEWVYGLLLALYSFFQFFGASYLGELSDRVGRKKVLLITQLGTLLSWFIFLIALYLPHLFWLGFALPIWIIAFSRILDGLTAGNSAVTNAYISDVTTREEKSYIFGYVGGITGLGMIIGPAIGGLSASGSFGYKGTIIASIIISIITVVAMVLWLKESLPHEKRSTHKRNTLASHFFIYRRIKEVSPKNLIKKLLFAKVFFSFMTAFYFSIIVLYVIDLFKFNVAEMGIFMLVVGVFFAFNQAFVSKKIIQRIGELNTLMLGLFLCIVGLFAITLTDNFWLYIPLYFIMNLGLSLCFPTFTSLLSIHSDPAKQGEIMGINESISAMAFSVSPIISTLLYGMIGFSVFHLLSILPIITLFIIYKIWVSLKKVEIPTIA
jgi:DHA1 family tetracycline resistance protein-like MFS transporter